jgi:hypothetical protein
MGSICSNANEYVKDSENNLYLEQADPSDPIYKPVYKKEVCNTN